MLGCSSDHLRNVGLLQPCNSLIFPELEINSTNVCDISTNARARAIGRGGLCRTETSLHQRCHFSGCALPRVFGVFSFVKLRTFRATHCPDCSGFFKCSSQHCCQLWLFRKNGIERKGWCSELTLQILPLSFSFNMTAINIALILSF